MRRTLATVTLASALTLAPVAATTAYAGQTAPASTVLAQTEVEETVTDEDSDDYGDWGLLGLLGLFGLFGYKKYKEHRAARTSTSTRTATTDDDGTPRRT